MPSTSLALLSGRYLSFAEREAITVLTAQGCGVREIARRVGRSASTISREVRRNAATRGGLVEYRATTAQWHADRRAKRPKVAKLAGNDTLREYVQDRLAGRVTASDGTAVPGPEVRSDRTPSRAPPGPKVGQVEGVRPRSPTGSGSTSPMMGRCGSRMRRSTRPCTSKAAAPCAVS
jgi:Helix-turn-helix domain